MSENYLSDAEKYACAKAKSVCGFYAALLEGGIPEGLAHELVIQFSRETGAF